MSRGIASTRCKTTTSTLASTNAFGVVDVVVVVGAVRSAAKCCSTTSCNVRALHVAVACDHCAHRRRSAFAREIQSHCFVFFLRTSTTKIERNIYKFDSNQIQNSPKTQTLHLRPPPPPPQTHHNVIIEPGDSDAHVAPISTSAAINRDVGALASTSFASKACSHAPLEDVDQLVVVVVCVVAVVDVVVVVIVGSPIV